MSAPEIIPRKTVVATMNCACCKETVYVKLDKVSCAYYYCTHPDKTGVMCRHKQVWGLEMTQRTFLSVYSGSIIDLADRKERGAEQAPAKVEVADDGFL